MSNHNEVILALKESLSKPDLHPRARPLLEQRLQYWLDKKRSRRREPKYNSRAINASVISRKESARRKRQEILPLILELRGYGLTYKEIAEELRRWGYKSGKGTPYSYVWVGHILREGLRQSSGQALSD